MGMFDSIYLSGRWAEQVKCPAGHPMTGELQTKDLECVLAHVVVEGDGAVGVSQALPSILDYTRLEGDVEVYGECLDCRPCYLSTRSPGHYNTSHPWVEARLSFRGGRLVEAIRTAAMSTDDYRRDLADRGSEVTVFDELPADATWPLREEEP